jgi:hypothetical protein
LDAWCGALLLPSEHPLTALFAALLLENGFLAVCVAHLALHQAVGTHLFASRQEACVHAFAAFEALAAAQLVVLTLRIARWDAVARCLFGFEAWLHPFGAVEAILREGAGALDCLAHAHMVRAAKHFVTSTFARVVAFGWPVLRAHRQLDTFAPSQHAFQWLLAGLRSELEAFLVVCESALVPGTLRMRRAILAAGLLYTVLGDEFLLHRCLHFDLVRFLQCP